MKVNLKYFASIREAIGHSGESLSTHATTLKALRDELIARGGAYAQTLAYGRAVRMALNQELCDDRLALSEASVALTEGCEVAFFPPVTGG